MYVPKALFTLDNLPPKKEETPTKPATSDIVGKFTVSDSKVSKTVFESNLIPKKPGTFVPPVGPTTEKKQKICTLYALHWSRTRLRNDH
jgi:hypothetical protein